MVIYGSLKQTNFDMNDDAVLIRAMWDSNVPKFLRDDLTLLDQLCRSVFNSIIKAAVYGELQMQIERSIKSKWLQPVLEFVTKCIQLFDTFEVRFGVMIVRPTEGGKTTWFEVIHIAMTEIRHRNSPDERFQKVKTYIWNPNSITMGELYGEVNPISQEWTDGLASKIMRNAAG